MASKYIHDGKTDQSKAGKHRLDDAYALRDRKRWRGAMYLAGYAVECLLKVKLMSRFEVRTLRALEEVLREKGSLAEKDTLFDHRLERFLNLSQVTDRYRQDTVEWRHFTHANRWMTAWRYDPDLGTFEDADEFLVSIEHAIKWIEKNV